MKLQMMEEMVEARKKKKAVSEAAKAEEQRVSKSGIKAKCTILGFNMIQVQTALKSSRQIKCKPVIR